MVSVAPKLKYDLYDYVEIAVLFLDLEFTIQFCIGQDLGILEDEDIMLENNALQDKLFCTIIKTDKFDEFRVQVLNYVTKSRSK
jgi:hypothetical protein